MKSRINPRISIHPKIIGYCIEERKKSILMTAALELDTDITFINGSSANEKVAYVAAINGYSKSEETVENPPECEVLIMSGLKSSVIDRLLRTLRNENASIDLKCTVTPFNQDWELYRLIEELKREHESMHKINGGKNL